MILEIIDAEDTNMFELAKTNTDLENFLYTDYYDSLNPVNHDIEKFESICEWCETNSVTNLSIEYYVIGMSEIAHAHNVKLFLYTYNDYQEMYHYLDLGVDCIFTDFSFI